jgi:hypothetical protein
MVKKMETNEVIYQKEHAVKQEHKGDYKFEITLFEYDTVILSFGPSGCQTMMHIKRKDLRDISKMTIEAVDIVEQNERDAAWVKDPAADVQK